MPKGKRRQRAFSWDGGASDAEDNYMNGTGSNNNVGTFSGRETNNGDSLYSVDQVDSARPRQTTTRQDNRQPRLGPWTEAVQEVVESMGTTYRKIKGLEDKFTSHMDELSNTDETRIMLTRLKEECSEKEEQINKLRGTIETLRSMDTEAKTEIARAWAEIKKSRQKLNEEETKQEKRVAAMIAEEKLTLTNEFDKLMVNHGISHAKRTKELEDAKTRMNVEQEKLVATLETQKKTFEAQSQELKAARDDCDHWKRVTESYKRDTQGLERKLQVLKDGLALESQSPEYLYVLLLCSVERESIY